MSEAGGDHVEPNELVLSLQSLPTLPAALAEILRVANNASASLTDLEVLIARDPTLAVEVLRVANSPLYGFRRRLGTIREAVIALGTRKVRSLASALALAPMFNACGGLVEGGRLWSHALAVAMWTQPVATRVECYDTNVLFTAGLMHDIGLVVLHQLASSELGRCLEKARASQRPHEEVENQLLGTNHGKVGAALCAKWMLPAELTLLLSHHHDPDVPVEPGAQVLQLADWLASHAGLGNFAWAPLRPVPPRLLVAMRLREADLQELEGMTDEILEQVGVFNGD